MANKSLKFCNHPGCNQLTANRYCDEHAIEHEQDYKKQNKRYDDERGNASARGYDALWQKVRLRYLQRNPLCELCLQKDIIRPSTLVHHIKPIREGGDRLRVNNLMALCVNCHEIIHKRKKQ